VLRYLWFGARFQSDRAKRRRRDERRAGSVVARVDGGHVAVDHEGHQRLLLNRQLDVVRVAREICETPPIQRLDLLARVLAARDAGVQAAEPRLEGLVLVVREDLERRRLGRDKLLVVGFRPTQITGDADLLADGVPGLIAARRRRRALDRGLEARGLVRRPRRPALVLRGDVGPALAPSARVARAPEAPALLAPGDERAALVLAEVRGGLLGLALAKVVARHQHEVELVDGARVVVDGLFPIRRHGRDRVLLALRVVEFLIVLLVCLTHELIQLLLERAVVPGGLGHGGRDDRGRFCRARFVLVPVDLCVGVLGFRMTGKSWLAGRHLLSCARV